LPILNYHADALTIDFFHFQAGKKYFVIDGRITEVVHAGSKI